MQKQAKTIKIFADYHHEDLYHSLRLLFEKRLGGKLYRPIGYEWFDEGFWFYGQHHELKETREGIKKQYLEHQITDGDDLSEKGVRVRADYKHGELDYLLTLDQFFKTDIDFVIASVSCHENVFAELCRRHPNHPKLIRHAGNIAEIIDYKVCKNLLLSCGELYFKPPPEINKIIYHQEFNLDLYKPKPLKKSPPLAIKSFLNCWPNFVPPTCSESYYPKYLQYRGELSEYKWKMYGALGKDGVLNKDDEIAHEIQTSTFVWHTKYGGDGYGHCLHNAFACGVPVIVYGHDYEYQAGKLGGLLLEDLETCIDLDKRNFNDNVKMIRQFSEPSLHQKMSNNVYQRFKKIVDFDQEEKEIRQFLKNLK